MKRLDRLVMTSFLGPMVMTFCIVMFILLMQFLWKYIDDLVGKGLDALYGRDAYAYGVPFGGAASVIDDDGQPRGA